LLKKGFFEGWHFPSFFIGSSKEKHQSTDCRHHNVAKNTQLVGWKNYGKATCVPGIVGYE
jgi:hypothetical protein